MTNNQKCKEPHPLYWRKKTDWLWLVATSRAVFTNHFSEQFFSRFASLPTGRKPNFWSYMLRLHTGAVCGLWFLLAIGSVGVFGIFTNRAKNMNLLRNWISTEIVTCIRHTSRVYWLGSGMSHTPCSQTNMLFLSGQNVGKPFRRWRKSETHSLETMAAIARSPWNPLSTTWYPDVGVPRDGKSPLWALGENETNSFHTYCSVKRKYATVKLEKTSNMTR